MNIVHPGSATVNANGVTPPATSTRAARRWPTTGCSTATGTSTPSCPMRASVSPARPSPSTRTSVGSVHPLTVTRASCSGASGGPVKSSVDSAEITCTPAPYDRRGRRASSLTRRVDDQRPVIRDGQRRRRTEVTHQHSRAREATQIAGQPAQLDAVPAGEERQMCVGHGQRAQVGVEPGQHRGAGLFVDDLHPVWAGQIYRELHRDPRQPQYLPGDDLEPGQQRDPVARGAGLLVAGRGHPGGARGAGDGGDEAVAHRAHRLGRNRREIGHRRPGYYGMRLAVTGLCTTNWKD